MIKRVAVLKNKKSNIYLAQVTLYWKEDYSFLLKLNLRNYVSYTLYSFINKAVHLT